MCIFCDIVSGDGGAEIVWDDDDHLAFLDTRPLFPGHTLLIPKEHYETLPDLPPAAVPGLFLVAHKLTAAVQSAMGAQGTFVAINNTISQSVPHLHVHVVPRNRKDGLRGFFWPRHKYGSAAEMKEVGARIRTALERADSSI